MTENRSDDGVRELLHEVWLAVHVRRFAKQEGETQVPDCFYAGVIDAEKAIVDVAERYGFGWGDVRRPAAGVGGADQ